MRLFLPLLLGVLGLSLQGFLRVGFNLDAWSPDLLAVVLLWLGTCYSMGSGAIVAALLGLVADGFNGSPVGFHMVHSLLLFNLALLLSIQVRFQGRLGWFLYGVAGAVVSVGIKVVVARMFLAGTPLADRIGQLMVPTVFGVVLTVPLLFPILDRLAVWVGQRPEHDAL